MKEEEQRPEQDCTLSVADAIREAMETPRSRPATPPSIAAPKPHLPLRKASADKLHARRPPPIPIFAHKGQELRGFNPSPSPVQAVPQVDNITASSEHAFAAKDEKKKPFRPPLGAYAVQVGEEVPLPSTLR